MITIEINKQQDFVPGRTESFRLDIKVVSADRCDPEIFAVNYSAGLYEFSHVCSPVDMLEMGTEVPESGLFRVADLSLVFRCKDDAIEAERILKLEIIALDSALKNEESMLPSETLVLGD